MGARLYAQRLGRFLTPDPINGGNENAYNYPDDPISQSDVSGRCNWLCDLGAEVAQDAIRALGSFVSGLACAPFGPACAYIIGGITAAVGYIVDQRLRGDSMNWAIVIEKIGLGGWFGRMGQKVAKSLWRRLPLSMRGKILIAVGKGVEKILTKAERFVPNARGFQGRIMNAIFMVFGN